MLRFSVPAFEIRFERGDDVGLRGLASSREPVLAYARRGLHRRRQKTNERVDDDEARGKQDEEQVERDFDAVGREHDEHETIVIARRDDQATASAKSG